MFVRAYEELTNQRKEVLIWINQNPHLACDAGPNGQKYAAQFHKARRLKDKAEEALYSGKLCLKRLARLKKALAQFDTLPMNFLPDNSVIRQSC